MATNYVLDPALVQEIVDAKNELKVQADKSVPLVNTLENYVNQISSGGSGVTSFKGRTGAVEPTQDDYSYNQLRDLPTIPQTTNQLSDVTLSNTEDNQALIWSETLQQWVNKAVDYNDLVNKPAAGDLLARADCYTILGSDVTFTQDSVDKTVNFGSCAINQKELFNTDTHEFVAKDNGTYKVILSLDSDDTPLSQAGSVVGFTYKLVKFNGTAWVDALDNAGQPIKIECIDNVVIGKKFIIGYITVAVGDRYKVIADVNAVGDSITVKATSGVVMFQPLPPDYKSSWGEAGFYGYFFTTGTASGGGSGDGITTEEATVLFENLWDAKTPVDLGAQPEDSDLTAIAGLVGNGLLKRDSGGVWSFDTNTYLSSTANAASASKLYTPRTLAYTGDITGTNSFDGSANISTALTLANSGVTAGTYKSVTVDAKGRVKAGTNPTTLSGYGITDAAKTYPQVNFGGLETPISTANFITQLTNLGAFNSMYWCTKATWSSATNNYITDTGVGIIQLAGCTVEVIGGTTNSYTIRIHTSPIVSIQGALPNADFVYVNHGELYAPKWHRIYNTDNKPTAADIGAAASSHVGATGDAHGVATTSVNGFMSAADKTKLDGLGGTSLSPTSGTMTPTVEGLKTAGTWSPAGSNIVEWVKVGNVVTFNVIVNGTLTGSSGAMNIRLPAVSSWGAFTNNTSFIEIPCQRFDGFTTEVKGLVSATPQWSGEYNYFSMHTQANTSPWARSNLIAPSGAFTLAFSGSVILK